MTSGENVRHTHTHTHTPRSIVFHPLLQPPSWLPQTSCLVSPPPTHLAPALNAALLRGGSQTCCTTTLVNTCMTMSRASTLCSGPGRAAAAAWARRLPPPPLYINRGGGVYNSWRRMTSASAGPQADSRVLQACAPCADREH